MTTNDRLKRIIKRTFDDKAKRVYTIPGRLGNQAGIVDVPTLTGFVYVTLSDEIIQVWADPAVPRSPGLPVMIGYGTDQPTLLQVLAVRAGGMATGLGGNHIGNHHAQHEWPSADTVYIDVRQILPLRLTVIPPYGIGVYPGMAWTADNTLITVTQSTALDLIPYIPITAGKARLVWVSVNTAADVVITSGAEVDVDAIDPNTPPTFPGDTELILGAVRLYTGMTEISESRSSSDVLDLRLPMWHTHRDIETGPMTRLYFNIIPGVPFDLYKMDTTPPPSVLFGLNVVAVDGTPGLIGEFNTPLYYPGTRTIPPGKWRFRIKASISATPTSYTTTRVKFKVQAMTLAGAVVYEFLTAYTDPITYVSGSNAIAYDVAVDMPVQSPVFGYDFWKCTITVETDDPSPVQVYYVLGYHGDGETSHFDVPMFTPGRIVDHEDVDIDYPVTDGDAIVWDNTAKEWTNGPSRIGTAPGSDTQVIFNDGGAFGADAGLTYNKTSDTLSVGTIQFSASPTGGGAPGTLEWDDPEGTLDLHLYNGSTNQIGQELSKYGKASATIANGQLVMLDGPEGNHIKMKPTDATVLTSPHLILGVATQNIALHDFGYVTWFGKVNGVYTTGWALGDLLYVSPTTYQLTNAQPTPTFIAIGSVIKLATGASENGIIDINPGFLSSISPITTHYEVLQDSAGGILADGNGNILYVEVIT